MSNTIIESWGIYLPEKIATSSEVIHGCRSLIASHLPLERFTGIHTRHVAGENQFTLELAKEAMERCFRASAYAPQDIDMVIVASISKGTSKQDFTVEPTHASLLCDQFEMHNAISFDITNACAGTFTALMVADRLIKSGNIRRALVVSGEYITHISNSAQREIEGIRDPKLACLTVGDAGICLLLESGQDAKEGFRHIGMHTVPEYADLCLAYASDSSYGGIMMTDSVKLADQAEREAHVMYTQAGVTGLINETPPLVIPHQTSSHAIKKFIRHYNRIHPGNRYNNTESFLDNLYHRGNTATTSHWIALYDFLNDGRMERLGHEEVVFCVLASGITIGVAEYVGLDRMYKRFGSKNAQKNLKKKSSKKPYSFITLPTEERMRIKHATVNCEPAAGPSHDQAINNNVVLAQSAAMRALSDSGVTGDLLKLLVYCGVYRERGLAEPAVATLLARHMKIDGSIVEKHNQERRFFAFDLIDGPPAVLKSIACGAYLPFAKSGLSMIATSEYIDFAIQQTSNTQITPAQIGSAILLEPSDGKEGFCDFCFASYPQYLNDYVSKIHAEEEEIVRKGHRPKFNIDRRYWFDISNDLHQHYLECILDTVHAFLQHVGLSIKNIDAIFPPVISPMFVSQLATALRVPEEKIVQSKLEHAFTASVAAAWEATSVNKMQPGQTGLFISVGSGIQVACALYVF